MLHIPYKDAFASPSLLRPCLSTKALRTPFSKMVAPSRAFEYVPFGGKALRKGALRPKTPL
ncbi:hypothetical protein E2C01_096198 [Portunus trituberculatus]|uniref:Uncharacterized protein n=1 Tax=Portunus trituberculatus TaxID=210409 RepID=A0A5B7K7M3_PORTR|nr:hypothetical protein [Portunus trituberculatus]